MNLKNLRRRLRLWTARMRGKDIENFSPHGVLISIPFGLDIELSYHLLKGKPYEAAEARMIRDHLTYGMQVIELGGSLGVISALIRGMIGPDPIHVIVEANPALAETCAKNAKQGAAADRTVFIGAAVDYSGTKTVNFDFGHNAHVGKVGGNRGVEVPAVTLTQLIQHLPQGAYALICDIEGAEKQLFENERTALDRADVVIIELHPSLYPDGEADQARIITMILEAGLGQIAVDENVFYFKRVESSVSEK